jgi:hypothetical protein
MKLELELTDLFGHVLLRPESSHGLSVVPNVGDMVSIGSKQWIVAKRHYRYQANGSLQKVAVQCQEIDL